MRFKRACRPPRPSGGRIMHPKGRLWRRAWSDSRCAKARKAIPVPLRPGDLRFLARL